MKRPWLVWLLLLGLPLVLPAGAAAITQSEAETVKVFPPPPAGWEAEDVLFSERAGGGGEPVREASRIYRLSACASGELELTLSNDPGLVAMVERSLADPEEVRALPGGRLVEVGGKKAVVAQDSPEDASLFVEIRSGLALSIEAEAMPKALDKVIDFGKRSDLKAMAGVMK